MAEYRFLQTRNGAVTFAKISVVSSASEAWVVVMGEAVKVAEVAYGQAILDGLKIAMEEQDKRNGPRFSIVVNELVETVADTTADAVECAAAVAAWKSFGGEEDDIVLRFGGGRWQAFFR